MALERQSIEKKDFPVGRRGYDPEAVDSHLAQVADQVEELRRSSRRRSDNLASAASDQVRAIVEAAESSASEIQRQAEEEADEIREEARREARQARQQAVDEAREHVGRVSESTAAMLQRIDAMESELGALLEALRTGANRLNADLQLLEGNFSELRESAAPQGGFEPEEPAGSRAGGSPGGARRGTAAGSSTGSPSRPASATRPLSTPDLGEEDFEADPDEDLFDEFSSETPAAPAAPAAREAPPRAPSPLASGQDPGDTEGARLIALNMALNGTPREETDRYLAENFQLPDREALLEEVYESVEG
jgi:DivIVA domain-containing protein